MGAAAAGPPPMLQIADVVKCYGGRAVVDGVTLAVAPGEIVCLLGPSGCGKTTLLRIVAGLEHADRGTVLCQGVDLAQVPVHRRNFGLMFQEFALFPHRSVGENIAFGLRMRGVSTAEQDAKIDEMLTLIGLPSGYRTRSIFELSGGERQRVALARSLAPNPRLLMLDEPLGSLDRALRERLMLDLRSILKQVGMTAIYVTHDQEEAYAVADRIVVMQSGQIVQAGSPQALYIRPATPFVARFLGFDNLVPVTVTGDGSRLASAYGEFDLPPGAGRLDAGTHHLLLMHPEAAELVAEQETQPPNVIAALCAALSFRGDHFDVTVELLPGQGADAGVEPITLGFHLPTYTWLKAGGDAPAAGDLLLLRIDRGKTTLLPPTGVLAAP